VGWVIEPEPAQLQIVRRQAGALRDSYQHPRPNLVVIMKRENEIGPTTSLERSV
jgi:hypothetical protein